MFDFIETTTKESIWFALTEIDRKHAPREKVHDCLVETYST
jgi:hypothetical protein